MKLNIAATLILLTIITTSLFSIKYTSKVSKEMLNALSYCETSVINEKWDIAKKEILKVTNIWNKNKPILSALLPHRELNEISDLIVRINARILLEDKSACITENKRLSALVNSIKQLDIPTFENLF